MEHVWGTFDLAAFKFIWGSFGGFAIFWKYQFSNLLFFYIYNSISTNHFIGVSYGSPHKGYFLEFRNLKFEKKS